MSDPDGLSKVLLNKLEDRIPHSAQQLPDFERVNFVFSFLSEIFDNILEVPSAIIFAPCKYEAVFPNPRFLGLSSLVIVWSPHEFILSASSNDSVLDFFSHKVSHLRLYPTHTCVGFRDTVAFFVEEMCVKLVFLATARLV